MKQAVSTDIDEAWAKVLRPALELAETTNRTFIAAIGTALLAKATDLEVDPRALKVKGGAAGSYSARSLAKDVLAPEAMILGVDLGVYGREPLNNQPFFRYDFISPDMDVKANARPALLAMCEVLKRVAAAESSADAEAGLRAFLSLRLNSRGAPDFTDNAAPATPESLIERIEQFVLKDSEGGRRAQAVAIGLADLVFEPANVRSGRVNDPDRRIPGDVGVLDGSRWARLIEVRDKPVMGHDVLFFARKVGRAGADRAVVLAVAANQQPLNAEDLSQMAARDGVVVVIHVGWSSYVRQMLVEASMNLPSACQMAYRLIYARLIELEASSEGLNAWLVDG